MALVGMAYLKNKLISKQKRVHTRYYYYEMKNSVHDFSTLEPPEFSGLSASLGWCAKAVDSLADRIVFDRFGNDDFHIGQIYSLNNPDILFGSAVLSALIGSCSFIYIGQGADGYPTLQVIDAANATGKLDPTTNLLTEGYAVLERDEHGKPILEAYFQPYQTDYYADGRRVTEQTFRHSAPFAPLVPIIYRPDARRPFGHSRISRSCMALVQSALRTLQRSEVSAEFYSVPQKYILGLHQDAEFNRRAATLSSFLAFSKDEDNDTPTLGQFQQQSMTPFIEQMRMLASLFAGETGLTPDDLGFTSGNPASFDAIRASHEALRLTAKKAQRTFATGFLNAGYLAACVRDREAYERKAFATTQVLWQPVFEPDAAALGSIGDAVYKVNQAIPGFIGEKNLHDLTGLDGDVQ